MDDFVIGDPEVEICYRNLVVMSSCQWESMENWVFNRWRKERVISWIDASELSSPEEVL